MNPPCILGPCGVVPLAGGSDVLVTDGALVHPQGVTTDCCKVGNTGKANSKDQHSLLLKSPGKLHYKAVTPRE